MESDKSFADGRVKMKDRAHSDMLDLLRIVAMMMVLLVHIPIYIKLPMTFPNGQYGVAVFFVLSGYLIMESLNHEDNLWQFYKKRLIRILPEYYMILIAGVVIWDFCLGQMPKDNLLHLGWLRYFLCLNTILPSDNYYYWNDLWGLWTISCFMFFYLVAPLLKKCIKSFRMSLVFLVGSVVAGYVVKKVLVLLLAGQAIDSVDMFAGDTPFFNLMIFMIGVSAWYAVRDNKVQIYLVCCIAAVAVLLFVNCGNRITWGLLAVAALLAGKEVLVANKCVKGIISIVSKYSFTIYLVHFPVFQILSYLVKDKISNGMYAVIALLLIVAVTYLVHNVADWIVHHIRRIGR